MPLGGVASELINSKKIGVAVDYNDLDGVRDFIEKTYLMWKSGENLNTSSINLCDEFDRRSLTKQLSEIFNELL